MEELILLKARELFFSLGLKSVSMNDLAKMSGISKKTIYVSYSDKKDIVNRVVDQLIQCHYQRFTQSNAEAKNAIEEVFLQTSTPFETWAEINPNFFTELEKFFPEVWAKLVQHQQNFLLPGITQNLNKGIGENNYRTEIDVAFMAAIRIEHLKMALQSRNFTGIKKSTRSLINALTSFYLHGIATVKGKKLINKYLMNTNEK